jgi:hypothetical protein
MTLSGPVCAQAEAKPANSVLPFIARREDEAGCPTPTVDTAVSLIAFRAHRQAGDGKASAVGEPVGAGKPGQVVPFRRPGRDALGEHVPSRNVTTVAAELLAAAGERLSLPVAALARRWPGMLLAVGLTLGAIFAMAQEEPAHFGNDEAVLTPPMVVTVELVADVAAPEEVSAAPASEPDMAVPPPPELADLSDELTPPEPEAVPPPPELADLSDELTPPEPAAVEPPPAEVEVPAPPELPAITPAQFAIPEVPVVQPVARPKVAARRATMVREAKAAKTMKRPARPRGGVNRAASTARQAASPQSLRAMRNYLGRVRSIIVGRLSTRGPDGSVTLSFSISPGGSVHGAAVSGSPAVRTAALRALGGGFGPVPDGVRLPGRISVVINFK